MATPPEGSGDWVVNAWVKQAVLLYFGVAEMETHEVGPFEFYDKVPLKSGWASAGVRAVPPATVRYGSFVEAGAILMPSYVNIGAYVGNVPPLRGLCWAGALLCTGTLYVEGLRALLATA